MSAALIDNFIDMYASAATLLSHLQEGTLCNIFFKYNTRVLFIPRNLRICECRTRKAFMSEKFSNIRHVILDEVQAFRDEDGDWLGKARLARKSQKACSTACKRR